MTGPNYRRNRKRILQEIASRINEGAPAPSDRWLTPEEVADRLGMRTKTIRTAASDTREKKRGAISWIPWRHMGRFLRVRERDFDKWCEEYIR